MYIFLILTIPIAWIILSRFLWHKEISTHEVIGNIVITTILAMLMFYAGSYVSMSDTATINGEVTSKKMNRVGCRHSYSCNCRTQCSGSGKSRSCYTVCDTCYEHSFDNDWVVYSNIGDVTIDTIDRQGLKEPPRWTQVQMKDPFSRTEKYVNYIKAAPNSLFNRALSEKYLDVVPQYPQQVYDYYKMNRFMSVGVPVPDVDVWNTKISESLRTLGQQKQANLVILITKEPNQNFADAVAYKWLGGKKNDIVVVVGVTKYPEINWVRILTWSKFSIFEVKLRDLLIESRVLDPVNTTSIIHSVTSQFYVRKEFKEFEYLKDEFEPPIWVLVLSVLISIISAGVLTRVAILT